MRTIIVLCLLATAAYADKLGYNYQPVGHSSHGLSFTPGSSGSVSGFGGSGSSGDFGGSSSFAGDDGGFDSGSASYNAPVTAEVSKEFYSFSAPEEEFDDAQASQQAASSLKKNIRVIFIKGPENHGLEKAVVNLAKQASEQRTAIYVLQKQHDLNDLANKLKASQEHHNHRPEVHFVKYRTPADAANAQRTIQSQYDNEGGSSQNFNGGVAPVINFASQAPSSHHHSYSSPGSFGSGSSSSPSYYSQPASFGQSTNANPSYLPPSLLRAIRRF